MNNLITYQKFGDEISANDFASFLIDNGIFAKVVSLNKHSVEVVGYNTIDVPFAVNITQKDFEKADQIIEKHFEKNLASTPKDYYLYSFSNDELLDIIHHPNSWGKFDYALAKSLLKEKNIEINITQLNQFKEQQIKDDYKIIDVNTFNIFIGFLTAFVFPPIGVLKGLIIRDNRKILPNGSYFYLHNSKQRNYGRWMIIIGVINIILILLNIYRKIKT